MRRPLNEVTGELVKQRDVDEQERQARAFIQTLGPFDAVRAENHSVPTSHLKAFTDSGREDGLLWMYDRRTPSDPKHLAPPGVAKQKGLYLIDHEEAPKDIPEDFFERVLASHVEAPFALMRNKLVYGPDVGILPVLTDRERLDLAVYMAAQQMRTAAHWRKMEWIGAVHATFDVRTRLEAALRGGPRSPGLEGMAPREIRKYIAELDRGDLRVVPPKEHWLGAFMKASYDMAPSIAALPWRLERASGGVEFVTCDAPIVVATGTPGQLRYSLGGGWANPACETVFALSPTCVLVIGPNVAADPLIGTIEWCGTVRDRTVTNADRFVFARTANPRVSDLLTSSKAPTSVVEFGGQQYAAGGPVGEVVKRLSEADDGTIIRWGSPQQSRQ